MRARRTSLYLVPSDAGRSTVCPLCLDTGVCPFCSGAGRKQVEGGYLECRSCDGTGKCPRCSLLGAIAARRRLAQNRPRVVSASGPVWQAGPDSTPRPRLAAARGRVRSHGG